MLPTSVIYIHEVVDPEIRGGLSNLPGFCVVFSYFFCTLLGALLPWYTVSEITYSFSGIFRHKSNRFPNKN